MTNADRIRSMKDDELTEFIDHITLSCYSCAQDKAYGMKVDERKPHCVFGKCTGKGEIAEWLKQEWKNEQTI